MKHADEVGTSRVLCVVPELAVGLVNPSYPACMFNHKHLHFYFYTCFIQKIQHVGVQDFELL